MSELLQSLIFMAFLAFGFIRLCLVLDKYCGGWTPDEEERDEPRMILDSSFATLEEQFTGIIGYSSDDKYLSTLSGCGNSSQMEDGQ